VREDQPVSGRLGRHEHGAAGRLGPTADVGEVGHHHQPDPGTFVAQPGTRRAAKVRASASNGSACSNETG